MVFVQWLCEKSFLCLCLLKRFAWFWRGFTVPVGFRLVCFVVWVRFDWFYGHVLIGLLAFGICFTF